MGVGVKERSGGKVYTNILLALDDRSIVFTVRDMKSGEMCGFVISLKTWETFDVSIVHGLNEVEFMERAVFMSLLEREPVTKSQDLTRDVLGYKLSDGGHLFLSCETQEKLSEQGLQAKAKLRVG